MKEEAKKIIKEVCELWGVSVEEVVGKKRNLPLPLIRCMAIKHIRDSCGLPFQQIGNLFNRNHATMIHYIKMYESEYSYNKEFRDIDNRIKVFVLDIKNAFQKELEQEYIEIIGYGV